MPFLKEWNLMQDKSSSRSMHMWFALGETNWLLLQRKRHDDEMIKTLQQQAASLVRSKEEGNPCRWWGWYTYGSRGRWWDERMRWWLVFEMKEEEQTAWRPHLKPWHNIAFKFTVNSLSGCQEVIRMQSSWYVISHMTCRVETGGQWDHPVHFMMQHIIFNSRKETIQKRSWSSHLLWFSPAILSCVSCGFLLLLAKRVNLTLKHFKSNQHALCVPVGET